MSINNSNNPGVSPANMQNLAEDRSRFRSSDMKLLRTGDFSDAEVIVGNRVWNVHKSIVCFRSGVMLEILSGPCKAGKYNFADIQGYTEKQMGLVLEYIYSGRIENAENLSLADCVELCRLGEGFRVDGMADYATVTLCDKLMPILQAALSVPVPVPPYQPPPTISASLQKFDFDTQFPLAVREAHLHSVEACQLILADFVWAARISIFAHPVIAQLNVDYPLFGSRVFTVLIKGMQSPFLQVYGRLMSAARNPAGTVCANSAQAQVQAPNQGVQLYNPHGV